MLLIPKKDTIIQMTVELLRGLLVGNPIAADGVAMDCLRRLQQAFRRDASWELIARHIPEPGLSLVIPVQPGKPVHSYFCSRNGGEA